MKAWIENNRVREICKGNPSELYHPDIAVHFDTEIDEDVLVGAELVKGVWVNPTVTTIEAVIVPTLPMLSPVEFKMLFTSAERIAIKSSTDPVVIDFFELISDPRLTQVDRNLQSVKDAIAYLESKGLIAVGRLAEIFA